MTALRIAAYVQPNRVGAMDTGVSKHIRNMVLGLADRPDVDLSVLASRRDWAAVRAAEAHPFRGLPAVELPGSRQLLEKAWAVCNLPAADRWCRGADWVYCPQEVYVPARRARVAVTVHCMNWFEPDLPWYGAARRERVKWRLKLGRAFRNDDVLILTVSEFLKGRLVDLFGVRPERIAAVGNGAEPAYFRIGDGPPPPPGPKYLLVVGGLAERKGGGPTLRVAEALRDRGSDLEIWIAGHSAPDLAAAARQYPNVKHLGYRGVESGLPELMRGAVALLFLSRYDTFGIPAVEAMAAGTPVIVSRYAGLPEVVGQAGLVVDCGRPDETADAATALATDERWRAELAARGRERSRLFTWDRCIDRLLAALGRGG